MLTDKFTNKFLLIINVLNMRLVHQICDTKVLTLPTRPMVSFKMEFGMNGHHGATAARLAGRQFTSDLGTVRFLPTMGPASVLSTRVVYVHLSVQVRVTALVF